MKDDVFTLIKNTIRYVIQQYGYHPVEYCVLQQENNRDDVISFDKVFDSENRLLEKLDGIQRDAATAEHWLHKSLRKAVRVFRSASPRFTGKKVPFCVFSLCETFYKYTLVGKLLRKYEIKYIIPSKATTRVFHHIRSSCPGAKAWVIQGCLQSLLIGFWNTTIP